MKRMKTMIVVCGLIVTTLIAGCGGRVEQYGEAVPEATGAAIGAILGAPRDYVGESVVVEGRISRECPTGCWFDVTEGEATLYVELSAAGLAIPQHVGKTVRVVGDVSIVAGQVRLSGRGVNIR
jgi:hypothetical protein